MEKKEREVIENKPTPDYPAWLATGAVVMLGVVDLLTHLKNPSQTVIHGSVEAIAFPMWSVWGVARGHTWVLYDKVQHALQKDKK